MDLRSIREFIVLAEDLNYSSASNRLFLSRSSLTKHIQSLESELGIKLFLRDSHSVRLTKAGEMLAERFRTILQTFDDAVAEGRHIEREDGLGLTIGYLFETASSYLPQACADYARIHEGQLSLSAMEVDDIQRGVAAGRLDVGLTSGDEGILSENFSYRTVVRDSYGVMVPKDSPIALKEAVCVRDLEGGSFFGPSKEQLPEAANIVEGYIRSASIDIEVAYRIQDIGSILPALRTGADGVLVVGHIVKRFQPDYAFVPLTDMPIAPIVALIWKKSREDADILDFVECVVRAEADTAAANEQPRSESV